MDVLIFGFSSFLLRHLLFFFGKDAAFGKSEEPEAVVAVCFLKNKEIPLCNSYETALIIPDDGGDPQSV